MEINSGLIKKIGEIGGRLRVKSALNPVLWLCAIITIPLGFLCASLQNPPVWLIMITVAPVSLAVIGFLFLLFFDRDKLQSEDYQIRKQSLELIQVKGQKFPVAATSIEAISNPYYKELPSHESYSEEDQ